MGELLKAYSAEGKDVLSGEEILNLRKAFNALQLAGSKCRRKWAEYERAMEKEFGPLRELESLKSELKGLLNKPEAERKVIDRMTGAREPSLLAFSCEIRVRNYGERIEELERKIRRSLQD